MSAVTWRRMIPCTTVPDQPTLFPFFHMLIDTHCHLASRQFLRDADDVIARAHEAGVSRIIIPATDLEDAPRALALAEKHPGVHVAIGIHPCSVTEIEDKDWLDRVAAWSQHEKTVAIGECGLDYFHAPPGGMGWEEYKARQAAFFRAQLGLAAERGLPVVVHHRGEGCWQDTVAVVREFSGRVRAQFHCYLGSWEEAAPLVEEGHRISFTGIATYKNAAEVAACAREAAPHAFMLETDAPYLAPVPHRGQRCEPAFVRDTAAFIATQRAMPLEELAALTTRTAEAFFKLPPLS